MNQHHHQVLGHAPGRLDALEVIITVPRCAMNNKMKVNRENQDTGGFSKCG